MNSISVWRGTADLFNQLRNESKLEPNRIWFVGDGRGFSKGFSDSVSGVIYITDNRNNIVRFGSFSQSDSIDDVIDNISKKIEEVNSELSSSIESEARRSDAKNDELRVKLELKLIEVAEELQWYIDKNKTDIQFLYDETNKKLDASQKGVAGGVATLGEDGIVPSSQLPSYVSSVLEFPSISQFPTQGESDTIYVDTSTNKSYRWSGTQYVEISASIALGETSSTAYRGDRGKIAYDHSQIRSGNPHNVTKEEVGLSNVDNTADVNKPLSIAMQEALMNKANVSQLPTKVSDLENDADYITINDVPLYEYAKSIALDKEIQDRTSEGASLREGIGNNSTSIEQLRGRINIAESEISTNASSISTLDASVRAIDTKYANQVSSIFEELSSKATQDELLEETEERKSAILSAIEDARNTCIEIAEEISYEMRPLTEEELIELYNLTN